MPHNRCAERTGLSVVVPSASRGPTLHVLLIALLQQEALRVPGSEIIVSHATFDSLNEATVPEISRVNLASVLLVLKGMGVSDPLQFDFLTRPSNASLRRACELLYALGALDDNMELSLHGKKMAKLPVDPIYAHLLLSMYEDIGLDGWIYVHTRTYALCVFLTR